MYRSPGVGLTAFGIVLVVVGAIMRFATSVHASGFNIHKIGDIFLVVGIVLVILSVAILAMGNRSRTTSPDRRAGRSLRRPGEGGGARGLARALIPPSSRGRRRARLRKRARLRINEKTGYRTTIGLAIIAIAALFCTSRSRLRQWFANELCSSC